jgi:hypothetical protein
MAGQWSKKSVASYPSRQALLLKSSSSSQSLHCLHHALTYAEQNTVALLLLLLVNPPPKDNHKERFHRMIAVMVMPVWGWPPYSEYSGTAKTQNRLFELNALLSCWYSCL